METTTYILIPGAWHGGWVWRPVAQRLRASGHRAVTLTLPGLGDGDDPSGHRLQDAIEYVVAAVERSDADKVTLVGHSWGGYPMAGAISRLPHRVANGIFYNALVPVPGRSWADDIPPKNAQNLHKRADASPNYTIPPSLQLVQQIMQDVGLDAQRLLSELLTPQPAGYFLDAFDGQEAATLGIPVTYILSENDHTMTLRPGTEFASRLGVEPVMVPGSHNGLLTRPEAVAVAIMAA
jgi:pimeloyl-ACP methyl ester carboxylesterase